MKLVARSANPLKAECTDVLYTSVTPRSMLVTGKRGLLKAHGLSLRTANMQTTQPLLYITMVWGSGFARTWKRGV